MLDNHKFEAEAQDFTIRFITELMSISLDEYREKFLNDYKFRALSLHLRDIYKRVLEQNHREITFENGSKIEYFKNINNVIRGASYERLQLLKEDE